MRKIMILMFLFLLIGYAFAEKSDNISTSEGWYVWYEKTWADEPVIFHFENISEKIAFKITWIIYCYDSSGKYLGRIQNYFPGPIHSYFNFKNKIWKGTTKMTAEIYNSWEYNP